MFEDPADKAAKMAARLAETERGRPVNHELFDHLHASKLGKTAGQSWVPVYNPATGEWELGSAGGGIVGYAYMGSSLTTQTIGTGDDLQYDTVVDEAGGIVTDLTLGYWGIEPGVYSLSAGVAFDVPGPSPPASVRWLAVDIAPGSGYKLPKQMVHHEVNDNCVLNVAIQAVRVTASVAVRAIAGQTAFPGLDVLLNDKYSFLSVVKLA